MKKTIGIVLLTSLLFGGWALSQVANGGRGLACYVGNCTVDLGQGSLDYMTSNGTAVRTPAPLGVGVYDAGTIESASSAGMGAIVYDPITLQPMFSNGTAWVPVSTMFDGGAAAAQFWADAGNGAIYPLGTLDNPTGGYSLVFSHDAGGAPWQMISAPNPGALISLGPSTATVDGVTLYADGTYLALASPFRTPRSVYAGDYLQGGVHPTASLPTPGSLTLGAYTYDEDLAQPVWSDGTSWNTYASLVPQFWADAGAGNISASANASTTGTLTATGYVGSAAYVSPGPHKNNALPTPASNQGGAISFDVDALQPVWWDGTAWQTYGSLATPATLQSAYNAGPSILTTPAVGDVAIAGPQSLSVNSDGGSAAIFAARTADTLTSYQEVVTVQSNSNDGWFPGIGFWQANVDGTGRGQAGAIYTDGSGLNVVGANSVAVAVGSDPATAAPIGTFTTANGYFSLAAPGATAVRLRPGARLDLGNGTSDYLISNNTSISTPAPLAVGNYATGSLPSASASGTGALAYDTTAGAPVVSDGTNWNTLATTAAIPGAFWFDAGVGVYDSSRGFMATSTPSTNLPDGGPALWLRDNRVVSYDNADMRFFPTDGTGAKPSVIRTAPIGYGDAHHGPTTLEIQGSDMWIHQSGAVGSAGYAANNAVLSIGAEDVGRGVGLTLESAPSVGGPSYKGTLFWAAPYFGTGRTGLSLQSYNSDPILFNVNSSQAISGTYNMALTSAGTLENYQTAGGAAFAVTANGARVDLGTGANDYLYSDGVAVNAAGTFQAATLQSTGSVAATSYVYGGTHTTGGLPANLQAGWVTYNSSDQALNVSAGPGWQSIPMEWTDSAYMEATIASNSPISGYWTATTAGQVSELSWAGFAYTPQAGGTVTVSVNKNGNPTACQITNSCTAALSGHVACSLTFVPGDTINLQLFTNGCGSGSPSGNVTYKVQGAQH